MNVVIKYAFMQIHFEHGLVTRLGSEYRSLIFPILNLIAVTISTERVHTENDIPRILGAMIFHDTVLAIFRTARLV